MRPKAGVDDAAPTSQTGVTILIIKRLCQVVDPTQLHA